MSCRYVCAFAFSRMIAITNTLCYVYQTPAALIPKASDTKPCDSTSISVVREATVNRELIETTLDVIRKVCVHPHPNTLSHT